MADGKYVVQYFRPDGWWEAGRGWKKRRDAERDASEQLGGRATWRVVRAGGKKDRGGKKDDD